MLGTTLADRHERDLTTREREALIWLLENGRPDARPYLSQISSLRVTSDCTCGCASINFVDDAAGAIEILSDYQGTTQEGTPVSLFAFAKLGRLAGIEIWWPDGREVSRDVPQVEDLKQLRAKHAA
jgi:hypothetical protein